MSATEAPRRSWLTLGRLGWLVALFVFIVLLIYGKYSGYRLRQAEVVPAQLQGKLNDAVRFEAAQALDRTQQVQIALGQKNWGSAADAVNDLRDIVDAMVRIAPQSQEGNAAQASERLKELEEAVRAQSDESREKLQNLIDALAPLST